MACSTQSGHRSMIVNYVDFLETMLLLHCQLLIRQCRTFFRCNAIGILNYCDRSATHIPVPEPILKWKIIMNQVIKGTHIIYDKDNVDTLPLKASWKSFMTVCSNGRIDQTALYCIAKQYITFGKVNNHNSRSQGKNVKTTSVDNIRIVFRKNSAVLEM